MAENQFISKKYFLSLIVSALILFLFFRNIDFKTVLSSIYNADLLYLAIILIFTMVVLWLRAYRWRIFLDALDLKMKSIDMFGTVFASTFVGALTPGKLGDSSRGYFMKKRMGTSFFRILSSFVIEAYFSSIAVFTYALIFIIFFSGFFSKFLQFVVFFVTLFLIILFIILSSRKLYNKTVSFFTNLFSFLPLAKNYEKKLHNSGRKFYDGMQEIGRESMIYILIVSFMIWLGEGTMLYFAALSLGVQMNFFYAIGFMALAFIIGTASALPGGLGSSDVVLYYFFGTLGILGANALSIVVLYRFFSLIVSSTICMPFFIREMLYKPEKELKWKLLDYKNKN